MLQALAGTCCLHGPVDVPHWEAHFKQAHWDKHLGLFWRTEMKIFSDASECVWTGLTDAVSQVNIMFLNDLFRKYLH